MKSFRNDVADRWMDLRTQSWDGEEEKENADLQVVEIPWFYT